MFFHSFPGPGTFYRSIIPKLISTFREKGEEITSLDEEKKRRNS
jgi:hypothetical protein